MAKPYLDPRSHDKGRTTWKFQISDLSRNRFYPEFPKDQYTENQARKAAQAKQDELRRRGGNVVGNPRETFGAYGLAALTDRCRTGTINAVSAQTAAIDLHLWRLYVMSDVIATMPIGKITHVVLRDFLRRLAKPFAGKVETDPNDKRRAYFKRGRSRTAGLRQNTIATISIRLKLVIDHAVDDGLLDGSVLLRTPWIGFSAKANRGRKRLITADEIEQARTYLAERTTAVGPELGQLRFEISLNTGMRPGEVAALQWSDIEMLPEQGAPGAVEGFCAIIHVQHAVTKQKGTAAQLKAPKTEAGVRDIPLVEHVRPLLLRWKETQAAYRTATSDKRWFVLSNRYGTIADKQILAGWWQTTRKDAGLPDISLYGFRYSFGGHHLAAGRDVVQTAEIMGHSDGTVTLRSYAPPAADKRLPGMRGFLQRLAPAKVEPPTTEG